MAGPVHLMAPLWAIPVAILIGLCVGSFLVALASRWEQPESIVVGRSQCPQCREPLAASDLVPLASWFMLQGKCRHCGERIGLIYPLGELAAGLVAGFSVALLPVSVAIVATLLGWLLLLAALIDLRYFVLPDSITLSLLISGLFVAAIGLWRPLGIAEIAPLESLIGAIAGFGILWVVNRAYKSFRSREGLGLGDAKLLAAAGAWIGGFWVVEVCLVAALITLTGALVTGQLDSRFRPLPFGPGLAFGFWFVFVVRHV